LKGLYQKAILNNNDLEEKVGTQDTIIKLQGKVNAQLADSVQVQAKTIEKKDAKIANKNRHIKTLLITCLGELAIIASFILLL
jgi:hypothetical protein